MLRHVLLCLYTKRQQPLNGLPPHIGQVARLCGSESGMATQQQASGDAVQQQAAAGQRPLTHVRAAARVHSAAGAVQLCTPHKRASCKRRSWHEAKSSPNKATCVQMPRPAGGGNRTWRGALHKFAAVQLLQQGSGTEAHQHHARLGAAAKRVCGERGWRCLLNRGAGKSM